MKEESRGLFQVQVWSQRAEDKGSIKERGLGGAEGMRGEEEDIRPEM